jgi:hypothetical protein
LGYRVEESAFADVGQTYDTCAEHVNFQCIGPRRILNSVRVRIESTSSPT